MKDGVTWSGFTKLPHLSGRSKPLHRRNTTGQITVEGETVYLSLSSSMWFKFSRMIYHLLSQSTLPLCPIPIIPYSIASKGKTNLRYCYSWYLHYYNQMYVLQIISAPSTISSISQSILITKPLGVKSDVESAKDVSKDLHGNKRKMFSYLITR